MVVELDSKYAFASFQPICIKMGLEPFSRQPHKIVKHTQTIRR